MAIDASVFAALGVDEKSKTKGPQKRYMMFLLEEWHEKIDKPLGKSLTPDEAKLVICNLLAKLASGEWSLVVDKK